MKLYGVTLTYNEADIVPYVMEYHKRLGFDKLIVYDNESTDNTVELLSKYPFVEVRTFKTNNTMRDLVHSKLKSDTVMEFSINSNEESWCYVGDFDEVLYYNGNFKEYLQYLTVNGYTHFNGQLIQPISKTFPIIKDNSLLHENIEKSSFWGSMGFKTTLIRLNAIKNIYYTPGCHEVVIWPAKQLKPIETRQDSVKGIHLKFIGYDRIFNKIIIASKRLSEENKINKLSVHYFDLANEDNFKKEWLNLEKNLFNTIDWLNGKVECPYTSKSVFIENLNNPL